MSDRKYSDAEVRAIIKKALVLQKENRYIAPGGDEGGLSLSDIDSVAGEVGISPELIRRAAEELDRGRQSSIGTLFLGGETELKESRELPVASSETKLKQIVMMIPSIAGEDGSGSVMEGLLTWTTSPETTVQTGRSMNITVTSGEGQTGVHITDRLVQIAGGIFGGIVGGVGCGAGFGVGLGVGLGALQSATFATLFPIGAICLSYLGARMIYKIILTVRRKRIRAVIDKLAHLITTGTGSA